MAGNVYVFNMSNQALNLIANGGGVSGIQGWSSGYQLNGRAVPRAPGAGPGQFGNGSNQLVLAWADRQGSAEVGIDGNACPLFLDLLLFVERNQWQLVDQNGNFIAGGGVSGGFRADADAAADTPAAADRSDQAAPKD
jgi:hypothetical protein